MTDHVEEAVARLKQLRKVGFGYDIKDEDRVAIDAVLSALAAAEERGRSEERERIRLALSEEVRNWLHTRSGKWITHKTAQTFADAITKEPTP